MRASLKYARLPSFPPKQHMFLVLFCCVPAGWHRLPRALSDGSLLAWLPFAPRGSLALPPTSATDIGTWNARRWRSDLGRAASPKACPQAFQFSGILEVKRGASSLEEKTPQCYARRLQAVSPASRTSSAPGDCASQSHPLLKMESENGHLAF